VEGFENRALAQLPRERVLASARPHDEHLHGGEFTPGVGASLGPGQRLERPRGEHALALGARADQ
jgi:hypothetical protein